MEVSAIPLRLAAMLGSANDLRLGGVRVEPMEGGEGVVLTSLTALRLCRLMVPDAVCRQTVVLPVVALRHLLTRHRDADLVSAADRGEPGLLQVRSYSSSMTCAVSCPQADFPAVPDLQFGEPVTTAEPCWLSVPLLAQTMSSVNRHAQKMQVLTHGFPRPLELVLEARGFTGRISVARLDPEQFID